MVFEAKLQQAGLLKKIIEATKELVETANWDCSGEGISLQAMDSSHVSLVSLLLRADGFEALRADKNINLGINMVNLAKILKCAANDDVTSLETHDEGDALTLKFETPKGDRVSEYEMKLMEIDSEHLGIPDSEYDVTVKLPSGEFQRICRDLSSIGDSVVISATKEGVSFKTSGELGSGKTTLQPHSDPDKEDEEVVIDLKDSVELTFALRYLNFFTKATPLSDSVTLSMSNDVPLVVEYRIGTMGYIRYYLAPKIEDEDESENTAE